MSNHSFTNFVNHLFCDSVFCLIGWFDLFVFLDQVAHGLEGERTVPFYIEIE